MSKPKGKEKEEEEVEEEAKPEKMPRRKGSGPATHSVSITAAGFEPAEVEVAEGDTVTWTNGDVAVHTLAFDDPAVAQATDVPVGGTVGLKFDKSGTFGYTCEKHPTMKGTITVA